MKNLKFRVWNKAKKRFITDENYYISFTGKIHKADYSCGNGDNSADSVFDPVGNQDDFVIQQLTCLTDKNGKVIFEGDIVKVELQAMGAVSVSKNEELYCKTGNVFYDEKSAGFRVQLGKNQYCMFGGENLEVIGNIMENPGLLTNS